MRIMFCFSLQLSRRFFGLLELVLQNLSTNFISLSKIFNIAGKFHYKLHYLSLVN